MLVPWLAVKALLTAGILGLIVGGSIFITEQPPPSLFQQADAADGLLSVEASCNRTDCSNQGECVIATANNSLGFVCECDEMYYGALCEHSCPGLCSGVGTCKDTNETTNITTLLLDGQGEVACLCPRDRAGAFCEETCPLNCSNQGQCHSNGLCECDEGYRGATCELKCECGPRQLCTVDAQCVCEEEHYGPNCDPTQPCSLTADYIVSTVAEMREEFPPECSLASQITVTLGFDDNSCGIWLVNVYDVSFAKLVTYSQEEIAYANTGNETLGLISFIGGTAVILMFRPVEAVGEPRFVQFNVSCDSDPITAVDCPRQAVCVDTNPSGLGEGGMSSMLYPAPPQDPNRPLFPGSFPPFDGSWTPALPSFQTLSKEAYYRPDLLSAGASNEFAVGLGWFTIVVAVLCCGGFIILCAKRTTPKEAALTPMQGSFGKVWWHEVKLRHALVGLCFHSPNSPWDLPAKFLMLFLSTFVNLALSALWLGQRSIGQMVVSILITAISVFVLMQLVRLNLKNAHLKSEWYVAVISYAAPLALSVWAAYTTGLFILAMSEVEAHFFLIRAVSSFVLQHTVFIGLSTALIVAFRPTKNLSVGGPDFAGNPPDFA